MKHSETTDEIAPFWVDALNELKDLTRDNKVNVKHKDGGSHTIRYADLAQIVQQARTVLAARDLAIHQDVSEGDGSVSIVTRVWHVSGQWIESEPLRMPARGGPQDVGGAITYGRRYQITAFLGLASEDDDGASGQRAFEAQQAVDAQRRAENDRVVKRARTVMDEIGRMTVDEKAAVKAWAHGHDFKVSIPVMVDDPKVLESVENYLDELKQ